MIDVAFTPAELYATDVAVVIDVLRATSTATEALGAGYAAVLCSNGIEHAHGLRMPGRVLAGERQCVMPAGFDQGNSPQAAAMLRGAELVLATTNGTPAVVAAARKAPTVLLGCMLNFAAVLGMLRECEDLDIQIVCAGVGGEPALEDIYVAGRFCAGLTGERKPSVQLAQAVARRYATPYEALAVSGGAAALRAVGLDDDVAHCARESRLDVVPRVVSSTARTATVVRAGTERAGGDRATVEFVSDASDGHPFAAPAAI